MPICQERLAHLLELYSSRKATDAEMQELFQYLRDSDIQEPVNEQVHRLVEQFDPNEPIPAVNWDFLYQQILEHNSANSDNKDFPAGITWGHRTEYPAHSRSFPRGRVMAAASLIILACTGAFYFLSLPSSRPIARNHPQQTPKAIADVKPGVDGAILTLADGQQIVLDSAGNGALGIQGSTKLLNHHGQLSYRHTPDNGQNLPGNGPEDVLYNTITTTRGKQYQLVLADGSRVWLNASSSIKFPTAFTGNTRNVEMTGEAYFEITPNAAKPFKVHVLTPPSGNRGAGDRGEVQVLGTHFNINAYEDEPLTRTTLLEGSVKVLPPGAAGKGAVQTTTGGGQLLRPGEQAQLPNTPPGFPLQGAGSGGGSLKVINDPDIEEVLAWKEGLFVMKKAGISTIMRQIARWYDVEVVYKGGIPTGRISGDIPRNMNLSKVLQVMELSGVHFTIDGKKVVVTP